MRLAFFGAAGEVTGSCHLVEAGGLRLLIDCGMKQGGRRLAEENADAFGFDPEAVDALLLTHAHLDHCGRIPLLVKRGFRGPVFTTAATRELARLVLLDAAGLQQEEARRRGASRDGGDHEAREALYDRDDVERAMERFDSRARYGAGFEVLPGIRATFNDAGHILGSASILLEVSEGAARQRLVFSGDLGNRDQPLLNPAAPAPAADALVMESTYGDRNHRSAAASVAQLQAVTAATLARGGNVVIPTFALERAQDLLFHLRVMAAAGQIPAATPVYLDSPMAISATEIFRRHGESLNAATAAQLNAGADPFALPELHFTRDKAASIALNQARGAVIMAGSGMASGGRILHHLQHNLPQAANSVVFVGFAARGTPARRIIDGAREVRIYGEPVPVRAEVHTIGGFSGHAGHDDLVTWATSGGRPGRVFLVHGEPEAMAVLARDLQARGLAVERPQPEQSYDLRPQSLPHGA